MSPYILAMFVLSRQQLFVIVIPTYYIIHDVSTHTLIALLVGWMMDQEQGIGHKHGHRVGHYLYLFEDVLCGGEM
jgi:hypothetical protein